MGAATSRCRDDEDARQSQVNEGERMIIERVQKVFRSENAISPNAAR